jgi:acetyl-CoA decarbonylase/synthase complex subunit delta
MAWEAATAMTLLHSGMDMLIMRHPLAVRLIKKSIDELMEGYNYD